MLALPHRRRHDRLAVLEEAHRVEGLEAPVEELLAFIGARLYRGRVENDRHDASLAGAAGWAEVRELALRRRQQAVARCVGEAGLHAVDGRVAAQEQVAVRLRN